MNILLALREIALYYYHTLTSIAAMVSIITYFILQIVIGSICLNHFNLHNLSIKIRISFPRIFAATLLSIAIPAILVTLISFGLQGALPTSAYVIIAEIFCLTTIAATILYMRLNLTPFISPIYATILFIFASPIIARTIAILALYAIFSFFGTSFSLIMSSPDRMSYILFMVKTTIGTLALLSLIQTIVLRNQLESGPRPTFSAKIKHYATLFALLLLTNLLSMLAVKIILLGFSKLGLLRL